MSKEHGLARQDAIPFLPQVEEALRKAARQGTGLTRVDRAALTVLGAAFRDDAVLRQSALIERLWPAADRKTALNRFHQFKRRFNGAGVGVVLCSPSDNRDPEEKDVWFEADRSPVERLCAQLAVSPEPEAGYDPGRYDTALAGRMLTPLLTFPNEVTTFGVHHIPDDWNRLSEVAREFLRGLSCRFMPFVQLLPLDPTHRVRGFELLASGSRGEIYGELMRQARLLDVSLDLLDVILMLVQVLTVQELRNRVTDKTKLQEVFFSLNLSPPLMAENCRLARAVIRLFEQEERDILRFELTEKFRQPEVQALAGLFAEFGDLKFAVDDANDHHLLTAASLHQYASFTKLSHKYVQDVLRVYPESPEAGLRALLKHGLPPKPHVLEGVEDFDLVERIFETGHQEGQIPEGAHIYAQGFGCQLDPFWVTVLEIPAGYGWRGQYVLPDGRQTTGGGGLWRYAPARYYAGRDRLEKQSSGAALEALAAWSVEPGAPLAYLIGDYGSGKTFTARMLCQQLRERILARPSPWNRAPLYIDLRDVPEATARTGTLEEVLRSGMSRRGLDADVHRHVLAGARAGRVLLVFDALDEKAGHLADKGAGHRFRRLLHAAALGNAKVLIVARQGVFADRSALMRETRLEEGDVSSLGGVDARVIELLPLDRESYASVLSRHLPPGEAQRALELLGQSDDLGDLGSRPVLLRWLGDRRQELSRLANGDTGLASLYEGLVRYWLDRDEEKSVLVPEVKLAAMESLALEMWRSGEDSLSPQQVQRVVIAVVNAFYGGAPPSDPARAALTDVRVAAFLTRDDAGVCRFAHVSLFEYFLARRLARRLGEKDPEALAGPKLSRGAARFVAELADPGDLTGAPGENAALARDAHRER